MKAIASEGALQFAQERIASRTEQAAHFTCYMIVVDGESTTFHWLRLSANKANPALMGEDLLILLDSQFVVVHQPLGACPLF